jgi:zinc protease
MLKDCFSDEEVQSAKSGLLQGKKVSRAQDQELVRILRNNVYLDRTMQWNEAYEKRLENLSTAEVNKVMNKYLSVDGFAIIKAGDMSKVEK